MINGNIYNGDQLDYNACEGLSLGSRDWLDRNTDCRTCPNHEENYTLDDNMEDFDPSLFCPDVIMELGDTPIEISNDTFLSSPDKYNGSIYSHGESNINKKQTNVNLNLTPEEILLKRKTYGSENPVQCTKIHCTSCNDHLGSAISNHDNVCVHPLLQVLICRDCYEYYQSGEFGKDEDGSEKYCRWCGEGGQVICCSKCQYVFCTKCIRRNRGKKELSEIKSNDVWTCFKCDLSQLTDLRVHCAEFMEFIEKEKLRMSTLDEDLLNKDYSECCTVKVGERGVRKRKRKSSDDEDDLDYDPFKDEEYLRLSTATVKRTPQAPAPISLQPTLPTIKNDIALPKSNNSTIGVTNMAPKRDTSKPSSLPLANINRPSAKTSQVKLLPNAQQILALARKALPKLPPLPPPTVNGKDGSIPCDSVMCKREIYGTLLRLAGRISSGLSSSLNRCAGKMCAFSLEEAVSIHNQIQDTLNNTIDSLSNLEKSLMEIRPAQNKTIINCRDIPYLQQHMMSSTKDRVRPGLSSNVSLFKCTKKENKSLQKNTIGAKLDRLKAKQGDTVKTNEGPSKDT